MDRKWKNNPDIFCYICDNILPKRRAKIIDFVKKVYRDYFGVKLGDQNKPFTTNIWCKTCKELEELEGW